VGAAFQEGIAMSRHKTRRAERRRAEKDALKLLQSPRFFNEFLLAIRKDGLVGEEQNALVLLVVVISRVLHRPLNIFVKGRSSAGKNWLVTRILRLLPKSAVAEITSASEKAWNYSGTDFRHRVVYVQEQNEAAGTIDPIRLLISERKLIRIVTGYENGKRVTKKYVAHGPVAAIATTTKNRLQIDDETRHISIWVDESSEQTHRVTKSYPQREHLSRKELRTWHMVHRWLEGRVGVKVSFPPWFEEIPDQLFVGDLSVRRYYPAFVEACRTVCLIRSFQPHRKRSKHGELEVKFSDFAITALIFDPVFVESLHLSKGAGEETRRLVGDIAARKRRAVGAKDIARELDISIDKAYSKLRYADKVGVIRRANKPEKSNPKLFLPAPRPRFVPDPEKLFRKLKDLGDTARFVHPITGKRVVYRREHD
jgi:DNA primase